MKKTYDNHQCGQENLSLKNFTVKFKPDMWIRIGIIQIRIRIHKKSWVRIRIYSKQSSKTAALNNMVELFLPHLEVLFFLHCLLSVTVLDK
jgi:hypothetical protein